MRKLPAICCLILIGLLSSTAKGEKVFRCQTELATGFELKNGSWREATFKQRRYTIKFNDDYSMVKGLPGLLGDRTFICKPPFDNKPHLIVCRDSKIDDGLTFNFNTRKLRFVYSFSSVIGYVEDASDPDTDALEAGTCRGRSKRL